jgi:hypothetical protein
MADAHHFCSRSACRLRTGSRAVPPRGAARVAVIANRADPVHSGRSPTRRAGHRRAGNGLSAHPLASAAGVEILRQGGNAVDAAVAVGFALAVVLPDAGNIGGGGFLMYRGADGTVSALDYREAAPAGAHRDMYVDSTGAVTEQSVTGHLSAGVPGSVAGMYAAWRAHGRLPWAALVAPAIRLAGNGHVIDSTRVADIEWEAERLARFPTSSEQFLPGGAPPPVGSVWTQPALARTLQLISDSGPDVFYRGQIADLIAAETARGGGLITKRTSPAEAKWRTPITLSYRGSTIYSMPAAQAASRWACYSTSSRATIPSPRSARLPSAPAGGRCARSWIVAGSATRLRDRRSSVCCHRTGPLAARSIARGRRRHRHRGSRPMPCTPRTIRSWTRKATPRR